MSELDEKLNALLSDPDRMAQIMQMAQSLSGEASAPESPVKNTAPQETPQQPSGDILSALTGGLDPKLLIRLMPLVQELGADSSSGARSLLYALRPYLKPERQDRVERALQLAKILHIGKKFLANWEG